MKRPERDTTTPRRIRPHDFYSPPKPATCRHCQAAIWTALYDDRTIHLDPPPLNQLGELTALITGRTTYTKLADRLTRRTARAITNKPTLILGTIHTTHHCGHPPHPTHQIPNEETTNLGGLFEPPCPY
ncbi:hypothetical protein CH267_02030 [Rhodococcus sp. 06-621-2]|nr:hypothetical protein CH267_02030 [Rhodococcus sp. 06-621-2]